MKRMICMLVLMSAPGVVQAEDVRLKNWHQWRGPNANGISPGGDPPLRWDATTNIKWKAAIPGQGSSTPIVWGEQIFILTAIDTNKEARPEDLPKPDPKFEKKTVPPRTYHQYVVLSYDRATGKERWRRIACEKVPHEGKHGSHTYAAFSPTTDGERVYVNFGSQGVFCYDMEGNPQWKREDLGRLETRYGWGEAITPVIHQDSLIVNGDHEGDSWLVVLDPRTGSTKWKVERDEPSTWATPLVVVHDGVTQLIVNGTNRVRSYDLKTGKVIWQCGGHSVNAIPSPLSRDGIVYCVSGYRSHLAQAIPLDAKGDITDTNKVLWKYNEGTPYVPSPILVGDRLYFTLSNHAFLTCLDVNTGKALMDRERLPGLTNLYASPVAVKDRIYFTGRDGVTTVIKASDKLEVLSINRLNDPVDASPAIVGNQIFLRSPEYLYCIEEQK